MLHRVQTMWRGLRERRRQYQSERSIYKAGKNPDIPVDHGNVNRQAYKRPDDLSHIGGGGGGPG